MGDKKGGWKALARRWGKRAAKLLAGLVAFSLLWSLAYSVLPPPVTPLMLLRLGAEADGIDYDWVPLEEISPHLVRSVIGAEDSRFCEHFGVDLEAIEQAIELNRKGERTFGASTLTMQTAKNAFLWPSRSWTRKGLELYFTLLIETLWSKRRIMEVYLNIAEWGPGIYGAEAAARAYFKRPAAELSAQQSALLAATLPGPLRWSPAAPTQFIRNKAAAYRQRALVVAGDGLDACVLGK